jgi:hypothetical protein
MKLTDLALNVLIAARQIDSKTEAEGETGGVNDGYEEAAAQFQAALDALIAGWGGE